MPATDDLAFALEWARSGAGSVIVRPEWDEGTYYWAGEGPPSAAWPLLPAPADWPERPREPFVIETILDTEGGDVPGYFGKCRACLFTQAHRDHRAVLRTMEEHAATHAVA